MENEKIECMSEAVYTQTKHPLVSVIVISYNNFQFLVDSIQSVLEQDYPNLELLISDDASMGYTVDMGAYFLCKAIHTILYGRKCLELEKIDKKLAQKKFKKYKEISSKEQYDSQKDYLQEAQTLMCTHFPQIKKVEFNKNRINQGTVKHLKGLKENTQGKYIMFLAADDKLHDETVISDMISHFELLPNDAYVLTSQCGMYDYELKELMYYAVNDELKKVLLESTPAELFAQLTDWCIVPAAGTIYKKKVFEKYGDLDPKYHLIEDWTYFLKLSRSGARIYFFDRLTYMHRDGGISHGNVANGNEAYLHYLNDSILLTENEIIPYLDEVTPSQKKQALKRYKNTVRERDWKYNFRNMSKLEKMKFAFRYAPHYIPKVLRVIFDFIDYRMRWSFISGTTLLFLYSICSLSRQTESASSQLFMDVIGILGLLLLSFTVLFKCIYYSLKIPMTVLKRLRRA